MIDFLRSLAPQKRKSTARASAVLPSRFAAERPLDMVPTPGSIDEEPVGASDGDTSHSFEEDDFGSSRLLADGTDGHVEIVGNSVVEESSAVTLDSTSHRASQADRKPRPNQLRPTQAAHDNESGDLPSGRLRSSVRALQTLAPKDRPSPVQTGPRGNTLAARPTPRATSLRAPLSAAAIANRVSAQTRERPIVHVTIDRLDVRAVPPGRIERPVRRRAQPTRLSLADYLQGGSTGRGGAR